MPTKQPAQIIQIKVTLAHSKPPIWRRIMVPNNLTLYKLHQVLQIVMGWEDYHLHQFIISGEYYGDPENDEWDDLEIRSERRYRLGQFLFGEGSRFTYEYDFGDGWEHILLVEKIIPPETDQHYPACHKGKRACPPEDVGGIWGYESFLEAIGNPEHPEHAEYLEWVGGEFDPEAFDLAEINQALKSLR